MRSAAPPALDWWRGFRSAELTTLMEETQRVNLDIAAATARFRQADALARQAGAPLFPVIDGNASASRSRSSRATSSATTSLGGRTIDTFSVSLSASYEIDFWGKYRDAALAADETAIASRFDRDVVALTSLVGVANAYFQVLAAQDRIRIANNNIASAQRIYDAFKQRLDVGTATDLDLAQQESALANQKATLPLLRQTLAQNVNALAVLVARPPESVNVRGGSLRQIALPRVTPGLPSELLTQRPDIRRAEAQLASATANVGNARAQFFPSITLDRPDRLSERCAVGAVYAAGGVLQRGRGPGAADLRRLPDPEQFRPAEGAAGRVGPDLPEDGGVSPLRT